MIVKQAICIPYPMMGASSFAILWLKFLTSSCAGVFSVHSSIRSKSLLRRQNEFIKSLQIFYLVPSMYKSLSELTW